jgi:geranylgeranyl diphosphate synthase type II
VDSLGPARLVTIFSRNRIRLPTADELLGDLLPIIDAALEASCRPESGCPTRLGEAMRYSLLAPGKRLRPSLVLMAAEACGGSIQDAIPAAVAVEMVHAYSLIHDDLPAMDDDDLRRGRPTCHIRFDQATAILAGDALLARAFEVLSSGLKAEQVAAAVRVLARAAGPTALVGGQADDLSGHESLKELSGNQALEYLESIHRRKTGALFAASLELGALAVQASETQRAHLANYATCFGLAFQIVDDLLDFLGSSEEVGKRTGKDLERGKLTFPGLIGVDASRIRAKQLIADAIASATLLGPQSGRLASLAQFVLQRSR